MRLRSTRRQQNRRSTRRARQQSTSIYFLLWATFTAFSLIIVFFLSLSQGILLSRVYHNQATQEMYTKGGYIQRLLTSNLPPAFEDNRTEYMRVLATQYDVNIFILSGDGQVLFPTIPETSDVTFDFSEAIVELKNRLAKEPTLVAVYERGARYIYGAQMQQYGQTSYLYIEKSLELMVATSREMRLRTIVVAVFVFVLAFAVSSAVSAWLIKPISDMTKKAQKLASGDFNIDFHGMDYGQEMVDLAETLNYARDELSRADEMQKQLIANVSHDFKTPLTMIKGYASMIVEISGDDKAKREKHAQIIIDETDRLTSLVNDVLELSKMRSGLEDLKIAPIDMSAYVHEVLARFAYLKETKGYQFTVDVEEELYTRGDEGKLGQVMYNLIGNAVNYTGEDKRVFVTLRKTDENTFRFSVRDTGKGIKSEDFPNIWRRYYRSSEMHKRPVRGTGLGLSIVKTVLTKHNFYHGVESEEGKGSLFFVDFPLYKDEM